MSTSIKQLITQSVQKSPSADNSQPWHIVWVDNILNVTYATRVKGKTFSANSPAILLSVGAVIENLCQAADLLGIIIKIDTSTYSDSSDNPTYFTAHFNQNDLNTSTSGDKLFPIFNRHTNRLPYLSDPLSKDTLIVLKKLTIGSAKLRILTDKQNIFSCSTLVRKASEIRFQTQEINEWLASSLRFGKDVKKTKDGLDVATLDLPPGGGYFLRLIGNWKIMKIFNFFGTYKAMSIIDSIPIKKAPALIAIMAPSNTDGIMDAGQLMERAWVELNKRGIAAHPYYVICDQLNRRKTGGIPKDLENKAEEIYSETKKIFQLEENEELQMLLRVGFPNPKKEVIRSQRLPFDKICSGL